MPRPTHSGLGIRPAGRSRLHGDRLRRFGAEGGLLEQSGIGVDKRGNVEANEEDYRTSDPKIWAAGDMRRGQSLVVWAIREGRQAARSIDEALMGASVLPR